MFKVRDNESYNMMLGRMKIIRTGEPECSLRDYVLTRHYSVSESK